MGRNKYIYIYIVTQKLLFTNINFKTDIKNKFLIDLFYKNEITENNSKKYILYKPLISYIININLYNNNVRTSINDSKGNIKYYFTSGLLGYKGSHKTKKYTIITILKNMLNKISNIYN